MHPETVKEMKTYLDPGRNWLIAAVALAVLALLCLIVSLIPAAVCAAAAGACFWRRTKAEQAWQSGLTEEMVRDFSVAQPLCAGELRVGHQFLFGKYQGTPVAYGQLRQVSQRVQKTVFETGRSLVYRDERGRTCTLCRLPLRDAAREDVMKVMLFIRSKNPAVRLGQW